MLCVLGDRGFRADLPPGLQVPLQQWHAKVTVSGVLGIYTLLLVSTGELTPPTCSCCPPRLHPAEPAATGGRPGRPRGA